ncbi:MAG TPA: HNH endonuclease signature motif containing protein [Pirellulales bacterium]|jgi:5-methylcytosine-specific restriction protein A
MPHLPPTHRPLSRAAQANTRAQYDRDRGGDPRRAFYSSRAWRRARLAHLRGEPLCRECAAQGRDTAAAEVDHILPRDPRFPDRDLDPGNLQSLCKKHHSQKTMRELNRRKRGSP